MNRMRVLLVKTSSMGDIVHSFPMVTDLRQNFPQIEVDWVAEEAFSALPLLHPAVRSVVPIGLRRWRHKLTKAGTWRELRYFWDLLRSHHYDVVFDSQGLVKSAVVARLARGPTWGADQSSARERCASWFYDRTAPMKWAQHAVGRNRELAARLFGYDVPQNRPEYGLVTPTSRIEPIAVCLHATSRDSKLWPEAQWRLLIRALALRGLRSILPYAHAGTADERRARLLCTADAEVLNPLPLGAFADLLSRAALVVGVDTGLVHLAAALGRPTVAIYVDTDPALNGVVPGAGGTALNVGGASGGPTIEEVLQAVDRVCP